MPFDIYAEELNNPWGKLAQHPAVDILQLFTENPFGQFTREYVDGYDNFVPFDRTKVLAQLTQPLGAEGAVGVKLGSGGTPFPIEGTINNTSLSSLISIGINAEDMEKISASKTVITYLQKWRFVLPQFSWSGATADDRESEFWIDVAQTEPLPDCFGSRLGWYHVISPRGYRDYFSREDLLATPALSVEELEDGSIAILNYARPLDFIQPETTGRIIEITNYLNEKRKD